MNVRYSRFHWTPATLAIVAGCVLMLFFIWGSSYEFEGDANRSGTERFHRKHFGLVPYLTVEYLPVEHRQLRPLGTVATAAMTVVAFGAALTWFSRQRKRLKTLRLSDY